MTIDDRQLNELIVESQDLQVDALRQSRDSLPVLAEIREDRRRDPVNFDEINRFNANRRELFRTVKKAGAAFGTRGLLAGGLGGFLATLVASPARADEALDIQILQTASSLEKLAVGTYEAALGLAFIKNGSGVAFDTIKAFAMETMSQHDQHKKAFQDQTSKLGGTPQDEPNPVFSKVVNDALPDLINPVKVVQLAATLEKVATDTYLMNLALLEDSPSKALMGSVMGVEAQHLAILLAVEALLTAADTDSKVLDLIAIPTNLAKLPAAAGSVAFPDALEQSGPVAEPESGAK
ncbi:MAG: ferritin-like domain-containing protein [Acidimicrobiales bacterium]